MQHNEEKGPNKFRQLLAGKGYYIALGLCIAAVGISGYVFIRALTASGGEEEAQLGVPVTVETLPERSAAAQTAADSEDTTDSVPDSENSTDTASENASETAATTDSAASADSAQAVTVMGEDSEADSVSDETAAQADSVSDAEAAVREQAALTVTWPVSGEITLPYSVDALVYNVTMSDWRTHEGTDIAAAEGQTVMAAQAGTVSAVYTDDYLGSTVVIDHDNGYQTVYANLNAIPTVSAGDTVEAGDVIGAVSTTALGEAGDVSHLHFEVLQGGVHIDPLSYLP